MNAVTQCYEKEFRPLVLKYAEQTVPELAQEVRGAVSSEYLRWPELHGDTDWESAVESLSDFLQKRIAFLDALWLENEAFYVINENSKNSNFYVASGMTAEELPQNPYDPEGIWYLEGTDIPFDVTQPITGNVSLSAFPASETPPPTEEAAEVETAPKGGYTTQDYITFASIAFLGLLFVCIVCVDIFRRRKDEQKAEQSFSHSGAGEG